MKSSMEKPKILTLATLLEAVEADHSFDNTTCYREEGLVVAFGMSGVMRKFLRPQSPYLIEDYRCGIVVDGELHGRINLMERTMRAGSLACVTPGSFVEPLDISESFHIEGIGMTREVFHIVNRYNIPAMFNGRVKDVFMQLDSEEMLFVRQLFKTLWSVVNYKPSSKETIYSMVSAIINHFNDLMLPRDSQQGVARNSANALFDRFIYLVNTNARQHRHIGFYADKMCISEHYLGTVVRQVSGITAKEWIDRAVITAAKVLLRRGDHQIAAIAEELSFPNASFFCKYFKRLAGCTPQDFRQG